MREHVFEARDVLVQHAAAGSSDHAEPRERGRVTRADAPDGGGPLAGLRVIELGTLLAGPFTGRLLGDLGAEIVKVEAPGKPDPIRDWGKARYEGRSLWWPVQSRNKKCITLEPPRAARAGAAPAARRARRRRHRELPAGDARALGARVRPPERGEPPRDPGTRLRLRADRAVRAARRVRVGLGGDGRHPVPERLPRPAAAPHAPLARRLARRHVRRPGDPRRDLLARRGGRRARSGRRRLADGGGVRDAREHRARVRQARDRARPAGDEPEGHRAEQHLQVARRQVDRDRGERRQRVPPALRGDGDGPSSPTTSGSRPTSRGATTRTRSRGSWPTGRASATPRRSTAS